MAWLLFYWSNCTSIHLGLALTLIQELWRVIRKGEVRVSSALKAGIYTTKYFLG